uniref:methenyltetrahydrofolate cyclohydrolase n=1 Tax=Taeniopygia guttata TaxID=59729 RepID=A0A674HA84_TAEGU
ASHPAPDSVCTTLPGLHRAGFWGVILVGTFQLGYSDCAPFGASFGAAEVPKADRAPGPEPFPLAVLHPPRAGRAEPFPCRGDAVVISGRKLARQIRQEARHEVQQWVAAGNRRPHLSVVLVGENPASHSYVLNKTKAAADVGISSETILRPASISEEELLELIAKLNSDAAVDGLLVQLPLPEHIDERRVCNAVSPHKDVDGFHVLNVGRMCLDQDSMLPATPRGVWEIIQRTGESSCCSFWGSGNASSGESCRAARVGFWGVSARLPGMLRMGFWGVCAGFPGGILGCLCRVPRWDFGVSVQGSQGSQGGILGCPRCRAACEAVLCAPQGSPRWAGTWWWRAGPRTWACPSPCCCTPTAATSAPEVGERGVLFQYFTTSL